MSGDGTHDADGRTIQIPPATASVTTTETARCFPTPAAEQDPATLADPRGCSSVGSSVCPFDANGLCQAAAPLPPLPPRPPRPARAPALPAELRDRVIEDIKREPGSHVRRGIKRHRYLLALAAADDPYSDELAAAEEAAYHGYRPYDPETW